MEIVKNTILDLDNTKDNGNSNNIKNLEDKINKIKKEIENTQKLKQENERLLKKYSKLKDEFSETTIL